MKRFLWVSMLGLASACLEGAAFAQDEAGGTDETDEAGETGEAAAPAETVEPAAPVTPTESTATQKMTVGADAGSVVPVGDFADGAGFGLAVLGRFEYAASPVLSVTARLGYHYHLEKNNVTFSNIPIAGGVKYAFGTGERRPYAAAEAGLNFSSTSGEVLGMSVSDSDTNFGLTLGGGYDMGKLDIRAGLEILDLGHAGDLLGLFVNVGYDFAHF